MRGWDLGWNSEARGGIYIFILGFSKGVVVEVLEKKFWRGKAFL